LPWESFHGPFIGPECRKPLFSAAVFVFGSSPSAIRAFFLVKEMFECYVFSKKRVNFRV